MFQDLPLFPPSASTLSDRVDHLYLFLVGMSLFFSLLISGAIVLFAVRHRRAKGVRATQIEGSVPLELVWTLIPLALVMVCFAWGARLFFEAGRSPDDALRFEVTGKQWMWKIQHPTGHREINDLHLPVGVPIELQMTSEDVIHSFYIPAFRVKQDVLPGRYTTMWFEATRPGTYHLFCAEYCGTKHAEMIGTVHALDPLEYERWLEGAPPPEDPVEAGARLFAALRCDTCHAAGAESRGPLLDGRFGSQVMLASGETVAFDAEYVRRSILEPAAQISAGYTPLMPTYRGQVSPEQIAQLTAYIRSLPAPVAEEGR